MSRNSDDTSGNKGLRVVVEIFQYYKMSREGLGSPLKSGAQKDYTQPPRCGL